MNLRAFIDESGDDSAFVMAGYVASVEQWKAFTEEWERLLPFGVLNERGTYQFKMVEMAKNNERMSRVPAFYRVIEKYAQFAVSVQFRLATLNSAMSRITVPGVPIDLGGWSNPYLLAFRTLTDAINMRRTELGAVIKPDEKIDFVFDERSEQKTVEWAWEEVRKALPPDKASLYGATPRFENDEEFLPLQAADLWAWWLREWEMQGGIETIRRSPFPWRSDHNIPPKLCVTFDEDGLIEYLTDKAQARLPKGKSFAILPASVATPS